MPQKLSESPILAVVYSKTGLRGRKIRNRGTDERAYDDSGLTEREGADTASCTRRVA